MTYFFDPFKQQNPVPKTICFFSNIPRMTPGRMPSNSTPHCKNPRHNVFSAERAAYLNFRLRRFLSTAMSSSERSAKPGNRVLDFGCGQGFLTRRICKEGWCTGMVLAVDVQEEMLRILQEKLGPEGLLPRIKTQRCDPDTLPSLLTMTGRSMLLSRFLLSTKFPM